MLLTDAHIKCPVRHLLHHDIERAACRHGRSYSYNLVILPCQLKYCMTEYLLVQRVFGTLDRLYQLTGAFVKLTRGMKDCLLFLGLGKSLPLYCDTVKELGTGNGLQVFQDPGEMHYIMSVYRAEIPEFQGLEHIALFQHRSLDAALNLSSQYPGPVTHALISSEQMPDPVLEPVVCLTGGNVEEVLLECTDAGVN